MDGSSRWMSCHAITTRDPTGKPLRMAGSQADITEEKTLDVLTGLPNRLLLISQLEIAAGEFACRVAQGGSPSPTHAVLFLDLNDFKTINDTFGHIAGDRLLCLIGARLKATGLQWAEQQTSLVASVIARMGGDEFAVLLEGAATSTAVLAFAQKLQENIEEPFDLDGLSVHCAFSIGATLASEFHRTPEDMLREADIAMYTGKVENRGRIVLFDPAMRDVASQQFELQNDIRTAVAKGEFTLVFQPQVELTTGRMYGVESLIRWIHPTRGLLQPDVFIPIAEKTGVIVEIGAWMLREACLQIRSWNLEFFRDPPLELSVNLSPREFKQKNLVSGIVRTLSETDFAPRLLHFELTEGALFEDIASARLTLNALKEIGVGLDLDDFGTGYSSLKYLRELPFDTLKIDKYFIASLDPQQASSGELVRAIINMADVLGLEVIAEGIESNAHRTTLRALGCRFGQGYYFGKPLNADALHHMLMCEGSDEGGPPLPVPAELPKHFQEQV